MTDIKNKVINILINNGSIPNRLKSHITSTIENCTIFNSNITKNGSVIVIALNGTNALHIDNQYKLVFFSGMARIETVVNKGLYNTFNNYYNNTIKKG